MHKNNNNKYNKNNKNTITKMNTNNILNKANIVLSSFFSILFN